MQNELRWSSSSRVTEQRLANKCFFFFFFIATREAFRFCFAHKGKVKCEVCSVPVGSSGFEHILPISRTGGMSASVSTKWQDREEDTGRRQCVYLSIYLLIDWLIPESASKDLNFQMWNQSPSFSVLLFHLSKLRSSPAPPYPPPEEDGQVTR